MRIIQPDRTERLEFSSEDLDMMNKVSMMINYLSGYLVVHECAGLTDDIATILLDVNNLNSAWNFLQKLMACDKIVY